MKILLTGATGFIGRHVLRLLLDRGYEVVATAHQPENEVRGTLIPPGIEYIPYVMQEGNAPLSEWTDIPETAIHLAWEGLPNFKGKHHLDTVLPAQKKFLSDIITAGCTRLGISGTCLEYGMREGCLTEDMEPGPVTAYGRAKLELCHWLHGSHPEVDVMWFRLFYPYGEGQNPGSLLPQLQAAIREKRECFDMSPGDQLRDFIPVENIAEYILRLTTGNKKGTIVNLCSGKPVQVVDFVKRYLGEQGLVMTLNRGVYPYPDYEPMAFWGDTSRLNQLLKDEE